MSRLLADDRIPVRPTTRPRGACSRLARVALMAAITGVTAAYGDDGDEVAGASTMSTSAAPVATSTPTLSHRRSRPHRRLQVRTCAWSRSRSPRARCRRPTIGWSCRGASQPGSSSRATSKMTYTCTAASGLRPNYTPASRRRLTSTSTNRAPADRSAGAVQSGCAWCHRWVCVAICRCSAGWPGGRHPAVSAHQAPMYGADRAAGNPLVSRVASVEARMAEVPAACARHWFCRNSPAPTEFGGLNVAVNGTVATHAALPERFADTDVCSARWCDA